MLGSNSSDDHDMILLSRRSVQFSEMSQLFAVECNDEQQWYSSDEKSYMKQELATDARRLGKIISTQSAQDISQDDIYSCIGIEHLLSLNKARRVLANRRKHVQLVIQAQSKCSEEELRIIAEECSRSSCVKAQRLAAGYFKIDS